MEKYDVVIIGAGIAGSGLVYHLKKSNLNILLIDKNLNKERKFNYRLIFEECLQEYNFPFLEVYDGVNFGTHKEIYLTVKNKMYIVDYDKVCIHLRRNIKITEREEIAIDIKKKLLITNKGNYEFQFLIDCSGYDSFLRKKLLLPMPQIYMYGKRRVFRNKYDAKDNLVYFLSQKDGYVEEFYVLDDMILQGDWGMSKEVDRSKLFPREYSYFNNYREHEIEHTSFAIYPISPALPLVYKNYAFLGDSFGNATPSTGEGIRPILETSKMLAQSLKEKDLVKYEKKWKKRYLKIYLKQLTTKLDLENRFIFYEAFKKNPELFAKITKAEEVNLHKDIKVNIPKKLLLNYGFLYVLNLIRTRIIETELFLRNQFQRLFHN